jgi:beta-mannosidase
MKQYRPLSSAWFLSKLEKTDDLKKLLSSEHLFDGDRSGWYDSKEPLSVHEILYHHHKLNESILLGECESARWVSDWDWVYFTQWEETNSSARCFLSCEQVDTFADFYLNGQKIASHDDSFLPFRTEITPFLRKHNRLVVHFHSPYRKIDELWETAPQEWKNHIAPSHLVRKPASVFGSFLGARPYLTTIGFAADVLLEYDDGVCLTDLDIRTTMDINRNQGTVFVTPKTDSDEWTHFVVTLQTEDKKPVASAVLYAAEDTKLSLLVSRPALWWPSGYGNQPLYTLTAELFRDQKLLDRTVKQIGFRRIEKIGDFAFLVNGKPIRLWGANVVNSDPLTQRWNESRGNKLLSYVKNAHMNLLRVWGEGPMISDSFYEQCDQDGILVWQDFPIGYGMWPDDDAYCARYRKEAETMVKRLKHHPCLLMWCGSNESYMYALSPSGQNQTFGHRIVFEAVQDVCRSLDPDRYYHFSSPSGGAYPQSPNGGDIHGYSRIRFEPGCDYPVLPSEFCHMTPLSKHSMLRLMTPDELFPKGYENILSYRQHFDTLKQVSGDVLANNFWRDIPVPETWKPHLSAFSPADLGNIQNYYDAKDADSLLYRYAACACDAYQEAIENAKRGRPSYAALQPRKTQGLLVWKLNDCFPHLNFTLIDAFSEPTPAYYAVKRGFSPILISLHREMNHLYLWGCNDTPQDVTGTVLLRVFSRIQNQTVQELSFPVCLRAGTSELISCLDFLGPIPLECLLHAQLMDQDQTILSSNHMALDIERNLPFPDAALRLEQDGDTLILHTDAYARYITLSGEENGDAFGWEFEDNYFDLFPFETKRIKLSTNHKTGIIRAKAQFSSSFAELQFSFPAQKGDSL